MMTKPENNELIHLLIDRIGNYKKAIEYFKGLLSEMPLRKKAETILPEYGSGRSLS